MIYKKVFELIKIKNLTISFAESVTGGLLASKITDFPSSSSVFEFGFVVYSINAKKKILSISDGFFKKYSVYSKECVVEMNNKLKLLTGSHICVSVSGVGGPTIGEDNLGTDIKIGTIYYDILYKNKHFTFKKLLTGSRNDIRKNTVNNIYKSIYKIINE